jgi:uncharacterized membrane protein
MKRLIGPTIVAIALTLASHIAVLEFAPHLIMGRALSLLEERGQPLHGFALGPRMTPENQSIVRPSPDLAYSACLFDLEQAPNGLEITMAGYDRYSSLSFFDRQTNNFATVRGSGDAISVRLMPPGTDTQGDELTAPTNRGVILIRRLAPTIDDYRAVEGIAPNDGCKAI